MTTDESALLRDLVTSVAVLNQRTQTVEKSLDQIKSHLVRGVWVLVMGVGLAFVNFVIKGGLAAGL